MTDECNRDNIYIFVNVERDKWRGKFKRMLEYGQNH